MTFRSDNSNGEIMNTNNEDLVGRVVKITKKVDVLGWINHMDSYVNDGYIYEVIESTTEIYPKNRWFKLIRLDDGYHIPVYFPWLSLTEVNTQHQEKNLAEEDIPGYTDSIDPEKAMQVLRSLCGKGS